MTSSSLLSESLAQQFHSNVKLVEKRPNIYQVYAPWYHEDGDMLDIYVEDGRDGLRVCDFGKTLMRLSYTFDLDTENKQRIFKELLQQNRVEFDEPAGNIFVETSQETLSNSLLHLSQVIAKVSRLDVLRREVVSGLFFEMLGAFIRDDLKEFHPEFDAVPIQGREELQVTCAFHAAKHPVYLIGVNNVSQARLASLTFLEFQKAKLNFQGCVVHDNMQQLPVKDQKRITSASDKQFFSLDDFKQNARQYLQRAA